MKTLTAGPRIAIFAVVNKEPHTQVPNLIYDIVLWLVSEVERDCLLYIIRRTYGYHDGQGQRKKRDIISMAQFEKGIITGGYLLDLGTNRSRNSLRRALARLEERQLIDSHYACTRCLWEQNDPDAQEMSEQGVCPRCSSSLTKSWGLSQLTPNKILNLLNNDPRQKQLGRSFEWDAERRRFKVIDEIVDRDTAAEEQDLQRRYQELRQQLWYPELVEQAIELAGKKLKSGQVSKSRQVNGFVIPVLGLQRDFPLPPLVKYALQQTIDGPVFKSPGRDRNWINYARRVAENNSSRFSGQHPSTGDDRPGQAEKEIRDLLRQAAVLNGRQEFDPAREKLQAALQLAPDVSGMFSSQEQAEEQITLAFRHGHSDFISAVADPYAPDFLSPKDDDH